MRSMRRRAAALCLGLAAAACAGPSGPVYGEWQGMPPSAHSTGRSMAVDLVLRGSPDAQSGKYLITTTDNDPSALSSHGQVDWAGDWTSEQRIVNGQPFKFIKLLDHLPQDIGGYALEPDGRLHALDPNGSLDTTKDGALYTLSPVPPRGR